MLIAVLVAVAGAAGACRTAGPAPIVAQDEAIAAPASEPGPAGASSDRVQTGIALFKLGEYARAEAVLREASGPEASAYLAASLAKQRKYAEAEAPAFETFLKLAPDSPEAPVVRQRLHSLG